MNMNRYNSKTVIRSRKVRPLYQPYKVPYPLYRYLIRSYFGSLTKLPCADLPLVLEIQTQSRCNGRCVMCPYTELSGQLDHGTMEWSTIEKIAEQLPLGSPWPLISLSLQNEPLLNKRIFDVVKCFKNRGKFCRITTNGSLLGNYEPMVIAQSNLDELIISLNATSKEMYESTNTGLPYDKVMDGINLMLSNEYLRRRIIISFVVTRPNQDTIYKGIDYWKMRGVRTLLQPVRNVGGNVDGYANIQPTSLLFGKTFTRLLKRELYRTVGCMNPFYAMNIIFNGDCILCCHDWTRSTVVGNITNTPLKDVWNSYKMNQIRRSILSKKWKRVIPCRECILW